MKQKRFFKYLCFFLILEVIFFGTIFFKFKKTPIFALAKEDVKKDSIDIDELKQKIKERENQIIELEKKSKEYQKKISEIQQQAVSLKKEVNFFDSQIEGLNFKIKISQEKINLLSLEIDKLNFEIEKTSKKIERNKETLKKIIQNLYQIENESLFLIFLKHKNFSQFVSECQNFFNLQKYLKDYVEKLKNLKTDLESKKEKLQKDKKTQNDLKEQLKYQEIILSQKKEEKREILEKTKNKEVVYQKILKSIEEQRKKIAEEIDELEKELRNKVKIEGLPTPYKGLLLWPLKGPVTQGYGATKFARTHYYSKFHNGIDIGVPVGTPVKAAYDGIVVALGNQDRYCWRGAYGKFIVIKHPNNLATLYAHLSLIKVKEGQKVEKGEIIGFSGSSGFSTGPHLHFTVYDARTFIMKQSRYCGLMPFGGSINPMKYLK